MKKYPLLMRPVSKQTIWGGERLKKEYGKTASFDKIAESWELTSRPDGINIIENGEYAGMTLAEYCELGGADVLGKNCCRYDRFPLLIKFIDAADRLSIQVHPDNEYAQKIHGELGKTEMWYIVDCEKDSKLVYGLRAGCTAEDLKEAVSEGRVEDVMNYVPVKKSEVYFIPSGQVHAIGSGILIAEIQQNSNITYRVHDYDRIQADGKPRELHTDRALDVIRIRTEDEINALRFAVPDDKGDFDTLCSCEYFAVRRYVTDGEREIFVSDDSFVSVLVLEAKEASISCVGNLCDMKKGDSFFIPAGSGGVIIRGKSDIITSKIN